MRSTYVVALDQGTTSSRAMLIDGQGAVVDAVQNSFPQLYPQPGWVEHDPRDILSSQLGAFTELLVSNNLGPGDIACIGITNQRETTVVWNRETGEPVFNAIVWQCRRTAPIIDELCADAEVAREITRKTGLVPDAYFSASKVKWILDNVPGAREDARAGKLAFGTVDSWLIWVLTQGRVHATDVTNASRTMLFDIHEMRWDPWLLDLFDVPASMLPEVRPSSGDFGRTANAGIAPGIPICGVAGDQQ
ncbi:MAG: FGGY family carbohydrate kinase, partial [Paraeggerthella sp.]|nr:FGGY family carbohydrate kinase [Paraeggerthella sp.]